MAQILQFPQNAPAVTTDDEFGGCPHCGVNDGYLSDGMAHWFHCQAHQTKWYIGLVPAEDGPDIRDPDWKLHRFKLAELIEVQPVLPRGAGDAG